MWAIHAGHDAGQWDYEKVAHEMDKFMRALFVRIDEVETAVYDYSNESSREQVECDDFSCDNHEENGDQTSGGNLGGKANDNSEVEVVPKDEMEKEAVAPEDDDIDRGNIDAGVDKENVAKEEAEAI